jgi:dinuclear metal center YbgI/SA1388 family protein
MMKKTNQPTGMPLSRFVDALNAIAPLSLSEAWDNTGLLLKPIIGTRVRRVMLTIDLTSAVAAEAVKKKNDVVIAYHPPLFAPLRELSVDTPMTANLLKLARHGIAVYSPHTALDATPGGVNDWLAAGIAGTDAHAILPIESPCRLVQFRDPVSLSSLENRIKKFLRVDTLRVAWGPRRPGAKIRRVAVCAGAGSSALALLDRAEVWITGEMKHHDVLAANAQGVTALLTEHTRTERGYLPVYKRLIEHKTEKKIHVSISREDRCPITYR